VANTPTVPISVVTPALNEAGHIRGYLQSLINQTLLPAEVIIIDHNSTDKTLSIAKSFIPVFDRAGVRLIVLRETRPGIAQARNTGWFSANQPIIASTDADCRPRPDWIKAIITYFTDHPSHAAVTGKIIMTQQAPLPVKLVTQLNWYKLLFWGSNIISGFPHFSTANAAVQKAAFMTIGGFNQQIKEINGLDDIELASRLTSKYHIGYCSHMVVDTSFRRYRPISRGWRVMLTRARLYYDIRQKSKTQ